MVSPFYSYFFFNQYTVISSRKCVRNFIHNVHSCVRLLFSFIVQTMCFKKLINVINVFLAHKKKKKKKRNRKNVDVTMACQVLYTNLINNL